MTIKEEYAQLISEHLIMQDNLRFNNTEEVDKFLHDFFPVETFLKRLYLEGKSIVDDNYFYNESDRFKYPSPDTNITMAKHFRYHCMKPHEHIFIQLVYVYSGNCTINLCGNEISITSGDLVLLAPNTPHALRVFCDDCIALKIYIKTSTFEKFFFRLLGENNILSDFLNRILYSEDGGKYIIFHTKDDSDIRSMIVKLYIERTNHSEYYDIISSCIMTEIFCRLMRDHIGTSELSFDKMYGVNIGFIIKYIKDNYRTVTLDELAVTAGYSKNYLCKIISRTTGKTYTNILNEVRISAATVMLRTTALSIWEIGKQSGFNSNEHFHRIFKRYMQVSPLSYRQQCENDSDTHY